MWIVEILEWWSELWLLNDNASDWHNCTLLWCKLLSLMKNKIIVVHSVQKVQIIMKKILGGTESKYKWLYPYLHCTITACIIHLPNIVWGSRKSNVSLCHIFPPQSFIFSLLSWLNHQLWCGIWCFAMSQECKLPHIVPI